VILLQRAGDLLREGVALDDAGSGDEEHRPVDTDLKIGELHGRPVSKGRLRRIHGSAACRSRGLERAAGGETARRQIVRTRSSELEAHTEVGGPP